MEGIGALNISEATFDLTQLGKEKNLFDIAIDKINSAKFEALISKDFISHLIGREDIKIDVEMKDAGEGIQELVLINKGKEAHVVLKQCWDRTHPEDEMHRKTLNFFFAIVHKVNPRISNHPMCQPYIRRFLLNVYFEIKRKWIWNKFAHELLHSFYVPVEPSLIIPSIFFLDETKTFWQAMNHCFHETIFFHHLFIEFMSLSKQLLAHYLGFVYEASQRALVLTSEERDKLFMDLLLDVNELKDLLGRDIEDYIGTSIFKVIKPEGHSVLINEIIDFDDKLCFAYRHVEVFYVTVKATQIEPLFLALGLYAKMYENMNDPYPFEPNLYITVVINKIDDVYKACCERKLPHTLRVTDHLVHLLGSKFIEAIQKVHDDVEDNFINYDTTRLDEQLRFDVRFYVDNTSTYIYEPLRNGTYRNLLLSVGIQTEQS